MSSNKFYITTSIVYTNAPPHIGFALESIQADVLARYHRLLKEDVFFLTGTDEHGAKVAKAAKEEGKDPKVFVDKISEKVRDFKEILNLSNDDFIRTTDQERHWPAVQKVWLELKKNGDIYKKKYQGLYCAGCEAFITKKDLKDGKCIIHEKEPQPVEEENYFFRLSKYSKKIEELIKKNEIQIIPKGRKNEMLSFIKQGLEDISFSRPRKDLQWGIQVPDDEDQTIYVWGDALVNYISTLGYVNNSELFKKFWPADVHCIGKDIQKFHSLFWPGMLLSLKLPLPKAIFVHGFITVSGQKMSKSLGNVIDPFELVKKYGTDPVRYFLLREIPSAEDGDFTFEKFEQRYNADLAKGLGNLLARVVTVAESIDGFQVPDQKFKKEAEKTWKGYEKALIDFKFNEALASIWEFITFCDKYIEKEKPWEKRENQKLVVSNLLFALSNIAKMLSPFLPKTSEKISEQLGQEGNSFVITKGESLFPRIS
ncbi:class I tRNA ligase family protein [Patescibacteria group bacterium]